MFKFYFLKVSLENYLEASVTFDFGIQWFIKGRKDMNRAVHGDIVVAQLLPEDEWSCPEKMIRLRDADEALAKEIEEEEEKENETVTISKKIKTDNETKNIVPTAKIVGILRRNWRNYCGVVLPTEMKGLFIS